MKQSVLEQEREVFQKQKDDLDMLIENDKKIIGDLNSTAYEREAAEARIEQREAEREWVSARLEQTERDLGLEDRRSLRERIKEIFKKKWCYDDHLSCCRRHNWGGYWGYHKLLEKTRKRFSKRPQNTWAKSRFRSARSHRSDCQLSFQSCRECHRLSCRTHMALNSGSGRISFPKID